MKIYKYLNYEDFKNFSMIFFSIFWILNECL